MKRLLLISFLLAVSMANNLPAIQPLQFSSVQEYFYNNGIIKCLKETHQSFVAIKSLITDLTNKTTPLPKASFEIVTTYNTIVQNLFDCGIIRGESPPIVKNADQVLYCFNDLNDLTFALKEFPALFKPSNFDLQVILHTVQGIGMVFNYLLKDCYLYQPSYQV